MRILIVFDRVPKRTFGEDILLLKLAKHLSKYHEVYIFVLSHAKLFSFPKNKLTTSNSIPQYFDLALLHHDSSFISKLWRLMKMKIKASAVAGLIYFIDTYDSMTFLKNVLGWFVLQALIPLVTFSHYTRYTLSSFGVKRVFFLPFIKLIIREATCRGVGTNSTKGKRVKVCYIGPIDDERVNPRAIAQFLHKLKKKLNKEVELVLVGRTEEDYGSRIVSISPQIRVVLIERRMSDYEKDMLLTDCDIALFVARRVRFLIPPFFLIEASRNRTPIYAPHLASILRREGINNVFDSLDQLIDFLTRSKSNIT